MIKKEGEKMPDRLSDEKIKYLLEKLVLSESTKAWREKRERDNKK